MGVHYVNIRFCHTTGYYNFIQQIKKIDKDYHTGRFTEKEDDIIRQNWANLCQLCNITQPEMLMEQMHKKNYFQSRNEKRQKNVIGCYLGINLRRMRHASDVFYRSKMSCIRSKAEKKFFSHNDDKIIMDEVSKNGATKTTWKKLSHMLNIDETSSTSIRERYVNILNLSGTKTGSWTLDEDTALLEYLFKNKKCDIKTVKLVNYKSFVDIREVKRSQKSMSERYSYYLQPILMSYHLGTLNLNWKYNFFVDILKRNYSDVKEVIWEDMVSLYPGQSINSLSRTLVTAIKNGRQNDKNFCDTLKEHIAKISKTDDFSEKKKAYQRKIVEVYLKCTIS